MRLADSPLEGSKNLSLNDKVGSVNEVWFC
ncbi:hypothetical protein BV95_02843 [Sphingobium chlorophenolicum]|uniref:Uncharacterized protein n=1 Tax=Sphingobium chlorophenolicum TaxID=46429 RepID=A0A081RCK9_SPHCR|nr:hypothetical protein BV95_02843 [Sphingobium chlorophenolicum]